MCPPNCIYKGAVGKDIIEAVLPVVLEGTQVNGTVKGAVGDAITKTKNDLDTAEAEISLTITSRVKDLLAEDNVEFINLVLGKLDGGGHVLPKAVEQRLIDADEDTASPAAIFPRQLLLAQFWICESQLAVRMGTDLSDWRVLSRDFSHMKSQISG